MIQWRFSWPLKSDSFSLHTENRGGFSVRLVHELTYFIIPTDETVCVYKVLQISVDWESLRLSASLICIQGNSSIKSFHDVCRENNRGYKGSLHNSINSKNKWTYTILVTLSYQFWWICIFTKSTEHIFQLWSNNSPKTFALGNTYIHP